MPKRSTKRYKMTRSNKIRLSRQLDNQLAYRQEQLAREETMPSSVADERKDHPARVADWSYLARIALFSLVLIIGAIAVWVAKRPAYSEVEKRELAKVPSFTVGSFFSGEYFRGVDAWFADTFPGREGLVKLDGWSNQFYRMSNQKLYGKVEKSDEIPVATRPAEPETTSSALTTSTQAGTPSTTASTAATTAPTTKKPSGNTGNPEKWDNGGSNAPTQTLGAILVQGSSAFEFYNFSQSTADEYVSAINRAASQLKGKATVYDMVVPTSIGVMLPESIRKGLNSSDQKQATDYLYGSMSTSVKTVPILDTLRSHSSEYLYFYSDHHWTALGAYYAYAEFAKTAGFAPHGIGEYEKRSFDGFKGSFFSETQDVKLKTDTVYAYEPIGGGDLWFGADENTKELDWNIINDVSDWAASSKYNTFIGGDNAYTEITSGSVHNGSAIVVVKESFGNAMVPFLVDHYEKVYVLDYRYYTANTLASFTEAKGAKTVLFINNMSATRNAGLVENIDRLVG